MERYKKRGKGAGGCKVEVIVKDSNTLKRAVTDCNEETDREEDKWIEEKKKGRKTEELTIGQTDIRAEIRMVGQIVFGTTMKPIVRVKPFRSPLPAFTPEKCTHERKWATKSSTHSYAIINKSNADKTASPQKDKTYFVDDHERE